MKTLLEMTDLELESYAIETQNAKDKLIEELGVINKEVNRRAAIKQAQLKFNRMSSEEKDALLQVLGVPGISLGGIGTPGK